MAREIECGLFELDQLGDYIAQYAEELNAKAEEIVERTASEVYLQADSGFATAQYAGNNDVILDIQTSGNEAQVIASGEALPFIEYGAGVHYNGNPGGYVHPEPADGIWPIGMYGGAPSKGMKDGWFVPVQGIGYTHGTPAQMPMYKAKEAGKEAITEIARSVLDD